jgi:DNA-binding CsgD family transcriptional regulator
VYNRKADDGQGHGEAAVSTPGAGTPASEDLAVLLGAVAATLILVTTDGAVVHANHGLALGDHANGLLRIEAGRLRTNRAAEDRQIRAVLSRLRLDEPYAVVSLRSREGPVIALLDFCYLAGSGLVALKMTRLDAPPRAPASRLAAVFGLTKAESRVARALLDGLVPQAVAALYGTGIETVRTQVKRIRTKTGARGLSQLIDVLGRVESGFGEVAERRPGLPPV